MTKSMVVVGGGIGGLASALACARSGWRVDLLEQADAFAEVGAGIQLGPNVVRVLQGMGLEPALRTVAAFPERLEVRNAMNGAVCGCLPLGDDMEQRYGAAYVTIARADLQGLLLQAAQGTSGIALHTGAKVVELRVAGTPTSQPVVEKALAVLTSKDQRLEADVLVGADGLWSVVRPYVVADGVPLVTGHLAFRAMVRQSDLPQALRSQVVTAWLGPEFHAVQYPVRSGEWLNVVCIVHGTVVGDATAWDQSANALELRQRLRGACAPLQQLASAIEAWRLWVLCDRPPMRSAGEHARGPIALVGDAAHPMRPYLAQGAGMAIEDAAALAGALASLQGGQTGQWHQEVPAALQRFAHARWQRNAKVQARVIRNGEIFHLRGPLRLGRDLAIRMLGQRLLDVPWLYAGP